MTIHLVYVHGPGRDTTTSIARELCERIPDIRLHHPNDPGSIQPQPGDILIGHPNRHGSCLFRRSFANAGWARRIVFAPFSHGMLEDAAAIDDLVVAADLYVAITGPRWFDTVEDTLVSHWRHKMVRCDLGVNRADYPQIKTSFNPPGGRRFVYSGSADPMKGGDFLARLADDNPDLSITWIPASNSRHCLDSIVPPETALQNRAMLRSRLRIEPGMRWLRPEARSFIATHDFVIAAGRSDAMPCEILEATSWGLVPATTPECGFDADGWMTHFPRSDPRAAAAILHDLNHMSAADLLARQQAGFYALQSRYNWDAVARQVLTAIHQPLPSNPDHPGWRAREKSNRAALRALLYRRRAVRAVMTQPQRARRAAGAVWRRLQGAR